MHEKEQNSRILLQTVSCSLHPLPVKRGGAEGYWQSSGVTQNRLANPPSGSGCQMPDLPLKTPSVIFEESSNMDRQL